MIYRLHGRIIAFLSFFLCVSYFLSSFSHLLNAQPSNRRISRKPVMGTSSADAKSMEFASCSITIKASSNECQISACIGGEKVDRDHERIVSSSMKISVPKLGGSFDYEDDDDRFNTPTSTDHKIPSILLCPAAPRKPKRPRCPERGVSCPENIVLDVSKEIQLFFPSRSST
ncbi:hypothetical protein Nepgr_014128 [Nepenthes gracilis]|uniref:Uncharacterized protein n=1 Tax=Nepenthes gracilis TaxID=150966 RepID=A0AAD3SKG7_NEPGR|nr:hypothetical protein Nepgr_014128 [Nepenthes gracilis]